MTVPGGSAAHWDDAYASGDTTRSWYQDQPSLSLQMFAAAAVSPDAGVIDVGGGASTLVDALLARHFDDVTVLDISAIGIDHAQRRLGPAAGQVAWVVADVLDWRPSRRYQVWHDRAVFHFLTTDLAQRRYLQTLESATESGSVAVVGCFAPDGPQQCSGLPVARYDAPELAARLGSDWGLVSTAREMHSTPGGATQSFTWTALRRRAAP